MQLILGALLAAGYASAMAAALGSSPKASQITNATRTQLEKSFNSATALAAQYPKYASEITSAAKSSFLQGDRWAYSAGIGAVLLGATLVLLLFPKAEAERGMLERFRREDAVEAAHPSRFPDASDGRIDEETT